MMLGLAVNQGNHIDPSKTADINMLARHHQQDNIFTFYSGRKQAFKAVVIFTTGARKLRTGQLEIFKECCMADLSLVGSTSSGIFEGLPEIEEIDLEDPGEESELD